MESTIELKIKFKKSGVLSVTTKSNITEQAVQTLLDKLNITYSKLPENPRSTMIDVVTRLVYQYIYENGVLTPFVSDMHICNGVIKTGVNIRGFNVPAFTIKNDILNLTLEQLNPVVPMVEIRFPPKGSVFTPTITLHNVSEQNQLLVNVLLGLGIYEPRDNKSTPLELLTEYCQLISETTAAPKTAHRVLFVELLDRSVAFYSPTEADKSLFDLCCSNVEIDALTANSIADSVILKHTSVSKHFSNLSIENIDPYDPNITDDARKVVMDHCKKDPEYFRKMVRTKQPQDFKFKMVYNQIKKRYNIACDDLMSIDGLLLLGWYDDVGITLTDNNVMSAIGALCPLMEAVLLDHYRKGKNTCKTVDFFFTKDDSGKYVLQSKDVPDLKTSKIGTLIYGRDYSDGDFSFLDNSLFSPNQTQRSRCIYRHRNHPLEFRVQLANHLNKTLTKPKKLGENK